MTLSIDTDRASALALAWSELGTVMTEMQAEVERLLAHLAIGSTDRPATRSLAAAGEHLWRIATSVLSAVEAAHVADRFDLAALTTGLQIAAPPPSYSPIAGDLGHTFEVAVRPPSVVEGTTDAAIGVQLAIKALLDTASNIHIRGDEFGLHQLGPNQYMLVLPGVTDLSDPDLGLSDVHRSPRDMDESAVGSFGTTSIESNPYARSVADAMRKAGVPVGAQIVIVGHSFGADTALDLAASAAFNGPGGYEVTHVLATGYHSEPQLDHVPGSTKVLVLRNELDMVVQAERAAAGVADLAQQINPIGLVPPWTGFGGEEREEPDAHVTTFWSGGFWGTVKGEGHHQSAYVEFIESIGPDDVAAVGFFASLGAMLAGHARRQHRNQTRRVTVQASAIDISTPHS